MRLKMSKGLLKFTQKQLRRMPKEKIFQFIEDWADARINPDGTYRDDDAEKWQQECMDLWDILTALRGPDDGSTGIKTNSTGYIRAKVLPKLSHAVGALLHNEDEPTFDPKRFYSLLRVRTYDKRPVAQHFVRHFFGAAKILGLITPDLADSMYCSYDDITGGDMP
jgi:hypothetical protein